MATIVPYLTVSNASEAIAYYKKAFDAKENSRMPDEKTKRIMHSDLTIHGGTIFVMDEFPEHGGARGPAGNSPVGIVIQLPAPKDVDTVYAQAVKAGAKGTQEPADMFWGARYASLTDPFGHT